MAIDPVFAAAYIDNDTKHRILGRSLKPFSLWHLLLLQTIESPFVTPGKEGVTLRDLKTAVGICSLEYRHSKVKRPVFPVLLKEKDLQSCVDKFLDYIKDYHHKPEYTVVDPDPYAPPAPPYPQEPSSISTAFRAAWASGVPLARAWNMPIGEAFVAEAMYFKSKGHQLDFMSPEDREMQEEMKAAGLK